MARPLTGCLVAQLKLHPAGVAGREHGGPHIEVESPHPVQGFIDPWGGRCGRMSQAGRGSGGALLTSEGIGIESPIGVASPTTREPIREITERFVEAVRGGSTRQMPLAFG